MKILIVEDNDDIVFLLHRYLQRLGFEDVTEARNGQDALYHLQKQPYDLVITDWMMPVLDGISLVQELRAREPERHTPVIMVSARDEKVDFDMAERAGVDAYITKPFDRERLQQGIRQVLRETDDPIM